MDRRPNWRPWQANPFTLGFLLAACAALGGVLEYLAQGSQQTRSSSALGYDWLEWYDKAPSNSVNSIQMLAFDFDDADNCLEGLSTAQDLQGQFYFVWLVLPSLIAVLLATLWGTVDAEIKRVEPFYQMSRPQGAKASATLFAEYISLPSFLSPIQAIYWKQWVVLLSAVSYVLIGTLTPILQTQLFQTQTQVLQVGFTSDSGEFRYFGWPLTGYNADKYDTSGMISYFPGFFDEGRKPLFGKCLVVGDDWDGPDVLVRQALNPTPSGADINDAFPYGAIRSVAYLDPTVCRVQEAILFLAAALTMGLAWSFLRRRSGMCGSWGNLAALAGISNVHPDFLHAISRTMDQDRARAKRWERALKNQTVHLGHRASPIFEHAYEPGVPGKSYGHVQASELGIYGLYFELLPQVPEQPTGELAPPRHSRRLTLSCYLVGLLSIATAGLAFALSIANNNIKLKPVLEAQTSVYPIVALILTAITKSIWRSVEHTFLALAPLWGRTAFPMLSREYSRMVPIWINLVSSKDGFFMPGVLAFISLMFDAAILLLGITTTMTQNQGYSTANLANIGFASVALMACAGICAFLSRHVRARIPALPVGFPPGSLAGQLSLIASSPQLRADVMPVCTMRQENDRTAYVRALPYHYAYVQLPAPHLTGAVTTGIERLTDAQARFGTQDSLQTPSVPAPTQNQTHSPYAGGYPSTGLATGFPVPTVPTPPPPPIVYYLPPPPPPIVYYMPPPPMPSTGPAQGYQTIPAPQRMPAPAASAPPVVRHRYA